MTIIVRPGRLEDCVEAQKVMNDSKNLVWLGGFTMLEDLQNRFGKQTESGITNVVVVVVDGEIRATSQISPHEFHIEMGLVAVKRGFRDFDVVDKDTQESLRHGYGSSMYVMHALRAMLEGRLFLLDQINWKNEVMKRYLPALGFTGPEVVLRNKIRNFCTLEYWRYDFTKGIDTWIDRMEKQISEGFKYEFVDSEEYTKKFDESVKAYRLHGKNAEADQIIQNRNQAQQLIELLVAS